MKSIRLTLMAYFLGLLTAALGVASLLVYQTAQQTLQDKEEATRKLIEAKYFEACREERRRVDDALLAQAQALARRVQVQTDWHRIQERQLHILGLLTSAPVEGAALRVPLWVVQSMPGHISFEMYRRFVTAEIKLPESDLALPAEGHGGEYFQIESNYRGQPLRSASLGEQTLPESRGFARSEVLHWEWDDLELHSGQIVRRVRLKASSAKRVNISPGTRPGGPLWSPPGLPPPPSRRRWVEPTLSLVVQCAVDPHNHLEKLAALARQRDEELAALAEETTTALEWQRNRLLLISSVTFFATVLGSFWLVWLGLIPLGRLSEAVSQVSPRNFRLPLDESLLPRELKPIAQRLTEVLAMLKRAFGREKQATADISHELRTPLAALMTTIDLALRKPRSTEQLREMLQDCRLSAQQMNQIVERMLVLARLDAGVDVLRTEPVDVGQLAEQCAAVVRPLAEAKGLNLRLRNSLSKDGVNQDCLETDPDKLREVLNNLLHNAVQYNRPHGLIDVSVARHNGHVELEVRDTGVGMTPEALEHVFERFYRADPSRNTDGMHAGLGLSIVKEYVDLMGGSIAVESTEGQGSVFRVQLPVR